ncbi:hypothetical protein BO99DRAFT_254583 [Aspergillus violaceofuscus CBS 115571]|uniref:Uncharacterized protein n=1 Tax=Aspergillus violaceofuscus (strain CBS 115571) TaxID=1450538 RepID=A0A2V5HH39_ASPV1|nr:hypothetical protein BO99DRAFT_254583 [Aspergillus violaceofuscus CBS 115571]
MRVTSCLGTREFPTQRSWTSLAFVRTSWASLPSSKTRQENGVGSVPWCPAAGVATMSFSVATVAPGYVYGRDERVLSAEAAVTKDSSPGILLRSVKGIDCSVPIHGGYVHIDDLAELYLRVLQREPDAQTPSSFGACALVDYADVWRVAEKEYSTAVAAGVLTRATLPTLPIAYDSSETEKALGMTFRPFEDAVKDVVDFYLERLEAEKASSS